MVTSDGFDLGKFVDAEVNEGSGKLNILFIEPNVDSELVSKMSVKSGKLSVPYTSVLAVNDFIVVDRKGLV